MTKSKNVARVFEAFGIRDSMSSLSHKVKDHLGNMILDSVKTPDKMGLLTEIAVTHAGIVNGNMGYYPPEHLKASAASWTVPYRKPVLAHHAKHSEPLGRNVGSIYKPSVPALLPKVQASVYDTDFSFRGLGHLQNLVSVNDPVAVQKVLDGRYDTVSISGDTDEMVCSICGTDWISDGKCEHRFGNEYETEDGNKLAYWTSGKFVWDELSFVNEPADPFAQIISREVDPQANDQVLKTYNYLDATSLEKQVADSRVKRLFNLYAVNDSRGASVLINDSTSLDSLYKVYGQRQFALGAISSDSVPVKDSKGEEQALSDTNKEQAQPSAEAKTEVVAPVATATDSAAPAATPATEAAASTAPVAEDKPAQDAKPEPVAQATPEAPAPEVKTEDAKVKELEARLAALEDENKNLLVKATSLQTQIKDQKINRVLDLKIQLNLDVYATEDERKKAFEALQARSMDSIEDALKDLEAAAEKAAVKRLAPKELKVENSAAPSTEEVDPVKAISDSIEKADSIEIVKMLMRPGGFNPPNR